MVKEYFNIVVRIEEREIDYNKILVVGFSILIPITSP